jgi:curved DNA-binding protein
MGGPPGDLYIRSLVKPDSRMKLEGYDVFDYRDVKLTDAVLGTTLSIPTLER